MFGGLHLDLSHSVAVVLALCLGEAYHCVPGILAIIVLVAHIVNTEASQAGKSTSITSARP